MKSTTSNKLINCLSGYTEYTDLFLRVIAGIGFALHGFDKFQNPQIAIGAAKMVGFLMPEIFGWALILAELVGGIFLILGLFTRFVTPIMMFPMLIAIFLVHWNGGFVGEGGYELALIYFAIFSVYLTRGGSKFSLDNLIFKGKI